MSDERQRQIEKLSGEAFGESERKEVRYVLNKFLNNGIDLEKLPETQKRTSDLWRVLGFVPQTIENKTAIFGALAFAAYVGGEQLITRLIAEFFQ